MEVFYKSGGAARETTAENLVLDRPSIVRLEIAPESVLKFERRGSDLVLVLRDGKEVAVRDFFKQYPDEGGRNDLLLEDQAGVLWWGQYTSPWTEFHFTEIEWDDSVPVALWGDSLPGWLIAGLAVLGVGAAAGGGGGGGGGGFVLPPVLPPAPQPPAPPPPAPEPPAPPPAPGNLPPTAPNYAHTIAEDSSVAGAVDGNDPDGDPLTYTKGSDPSNGTVTVNPDGSYTYTPHPDYHGPDEFTVIVSDGQGGTTTSTVVITVTPVNDPPVAPGYEHTTPEDTPISGKVQGSDPDGDPLTYTKATDPKNGTVTVSPDGSYTYTPHPDYHGPDEFTVTVSDGQGGTTTSTVIITVTPVNDPPVAPGYQHTTPEDTPVSGKVIGSDPDGDPLTYAKATDPSHGTVTVNPDGSYTYTPHPNYYGPDEFTVTVSDGQGGTTTSTVLITVTPVNDTPEARNDTGSVTEDVPGPLTGNVVDNDKLGDDTRADHTVSWDPADTPEYGSIVRNPDGSYSYALDNDDPRVNALKTGETLTETFSYTLRDKDGETSTATLTITIHGRTDTDSPPTIVPVDGNEGADTDIEQAGQATVYEAGLTRDGEGGKTATGTLAISTPDGLETVTIGDPAAGGITLTQADLEALATATTPVTVLTPHGTLTLTGYVSTGNVGGVDTGGTISYSYELTVPVDNDSVAGATPVNHLDTIALSVTDAGGDTQAGALQVNIIDDVPAAVADTNSIAEDAVSVAGNVITGVGNTGGAGADTVGADVPANPVTHVIAGAAQPTTPVIAGGTEVTGSYGKLTLNPDGSYTYELDNANLQVQGLIEGEALTETFSYTLTDEDGDTSTTTLTLTINGTDDGVTVQVPNDSAATTPDANANDHVVFESHLGSGSAGSKDADNLIVESRFTIEALDGLDASDAVVLSFTGADGNPDTLTLTQAQLEGLDSGAGKQTIGTQYGTLELDGYSRAADGTITVSYTYTLTKAPSVSGADTTELIGITAKDRDGDSDASAAIRIKIVDDAPTAVADTNSIAEDAVSVAGNVITGVGNTGGAGADTVGADVLANPVTHVIAGAAQPTTPVIAGGTEVTGSYGKLTLNPDGSYTYELDNANLQVQGLIEGEALTETFSYTLTDEDGDTSTTTLTLTINGTDDGVTVQVPNDSAATTPDANANDHVVFESHLGSGSAGSKDADNLIVESRFTIEALDGLDASDAVVLSFTGADGNPDTLTLTQAQLEGLDSGAGKQTIGTQYGTLELDGYSRAADGTITVSYTYTLTKAPSVSGADTTELIGITAKDRDGDSDASAAIRIKIVDDAPTAADQAEVSLDEGGVTVGYVSNAWTTGTANLLGNDTQGADGARVHQIIYTPAGGGAPLTATVPAGSSSTVPTQYGSLTVHSNGDWSYTSSAAVAHGSATSLPDGFSYTLIDGDGDISASATQPITIQDTAPALGTPSANTGVDEDDLISGSDTQKETLTVSGSLAVTKGADPIDTQLSISGAPQGLTSGTVGVQYELSVDGHTLTAYKGAGRLEADKVFTVTVTDPTGASGSPGYSFTLQGPLDHADAGGENSLNLQFGFEAKETEAADGDAVSGNFTVTVTDDVPAISPSVAALPSLVVDESDLDADADEVITGGFASLFSVTPGADGVATVYTVGVGSASGLKDTATGADVALAVTSVSGTTTTVTGTVDDPANPGSKLTVLVITLDSASGAVTLDQQRAVQHADPLSHDETVSLAAEAITITATVTDGDGDVGTSTRNVGGSFVFNDDGPSIEATGAKPGTVMEVDETQMGVASVSVDFSGVFAASIDYGADAAALSNALRYELVAGTAPTGLTDTATGRGILLVSNADGSIEGRVATAGGSAGADVAFTITVSTTGEVQLIQARALRHADGTQHNDALQPTADSIHLRASVTDRDDDTDSAFIDISTSFRFLDDGPSVSGTTDAIVGEALLPTGSGSPATHPVSAGGALGAATGADGGGVRFDAAQSVPSNLTSNDLPVTYAVSGNGQTLTATAGGHTVFTVTLSADGSTYDFVLSRALDHASPSNISLPFTFTVTDGDGDTATGTFNVQVVDDQRADGSEQSIPVIEDTPYTFNTTADGTGVTVPTEGAAGYPSHGTISAPDAQGRITYTPDPDYSGADEFTYTIINEDDPGDVRTVTVKVTVAPVADAPSLPTDPSIAPPTGAGNVPTVLTLEDQSKALGLLKPVVSDNTDQNGVGTAGDHGERIGGITLVVQNAGGGANTTGATLTKSDGTALIPTATGGSTYSVVIVTTSGDSSTIDTSLHLTSGSGLPTGNVNYLTQAEYEALMARPAHERHENFRVQVRATSYEVDDDGNQLASVAGVQSTQNVNVRVQAVTDPVDLKIDDGTGAFVEADSAANAVVVQLTEDTAFNLATLLQVDLPNDASNPLYDDNGVDDIDGSEARWFVISGLPVGAVVNGQEITSENPTVRIDIPRDSGGVQAALPSIEVTAPHDFSGVLSGIQITLYAQDQDSDGVGAGATTGTQISDSVYLTLHVAPEAGDDVAVDEVSTPEDTAVSFLAGVHVTDSGTSAGIQVINSVSFSVPDGWTFTPPTSGGLATVGWEITGSGSGPYTITFNDGPTGTVLDEAAREALLDGTTFQITPPAHSSADVDITLTIKSTDTNSAGGPASEHEGTYNLRVAVTPFAERTDSDSNVDMPAANDVAMHGDESYAAVPGREDEWFALGTDYTDSANTSGGHDLSEGWGNEDADEFTFAALTPVLIAGDAGDTVNGTVFRWYDGSDWVEDVYNGTAAVWVPVQYLDTLQFKAPANVAGTFQIQMQAVTVDYDDDAEPSSAPTGPVSDGLPGVSVQYSDTSLLTAITIAPVADDVTMAVNGKAKGLERAEPGDTASPIPLSIVVTSSDSSEKVSVRIEGIPAGATLHYGAGQTYTAPTGGGALTITDFNGVNAGPVGILPPPQYSGSFPLHVESWSVESDDSTSTVYDRTITVDVVGVADAVLFDAIPVGTGSNRVVSEATLDAGGRIALEDLIDNVRTADTANPAGNDNSETISFRITGLPEGFTLEGATLIGGVTGAARVWAVSESQLANVKIEAPANFSGTQTFQVQGISTEKDGDSRTMPVVDVSFQVSPSVDGIANDGNAELVEDVASALNLDIVHRHGDSDETLGDVWIRADQVSTPAYQILLGGSVLSGTAVSHPDFPGATYIRVAAADVPHLEVLGGLHKDGVLGTFDFLYEVIDDHYDATATTPSDSQVKQGTFTLTAAAVTDNITLAALDDTRISGMNTTVVGNVAEVNAAGSIVTVNLVVDSDDQDGSERVVRVIIEGVPEGVTVLGGEQTSGTSWVLVLDSANAIQDGPVTVPVQFRVSEAAGGLPEREIHMTVQVKDRGDAVAYTAVDGDRKQATQSWKLKTNFEVGDGFEPPTIDTWSYNNQHVSEDAPRPLGELINVGVTVQEPGQTNTFTVSLTDVPAGTTITGMALTSVNGVPTWTATLAVAPADSANADELLKAFLDDIHITPPANWNDNNHLGDFNFNATLSTSAGGTSESRSIGMTVPVDPVTDPAVINVVVNGGNELDEDPSPGSGIPVTITVTHPADGIYGSIVGDVMYVSVHATAGNAGGTLTDGNGDPLTEVSPGVYEVPVTAGVAVDLVYTPLNGTHPGDVSFSVEVQTQEENAAAPLSATGAGTVEIVVVNNGVQEANEPGDPRPTDALATGPEPGSSAVGAAIPIPAITATLVDGGENVTAVMLEGVPVGFLVYVGGQLATNAGGSGGTNTWVLSNGPLTGEVSILPPLHWSGEVTGLNLLVESGEPTLSETRVDTVFLGALVVEPVANGLSIAPTHSFGTEGQIIGLNLNASMVDPGASMATDSSTETTTVQFTGMGPQATFYVGGVAHAATYEAASDTYTLGGLTQDDLAGLGFRQANPALEDQDLGTTGLQIGVRAQTVESGGGVPSAWTDVEHITLNLQNQQPTSGADHLLWAVSSTQPQPVLNAGGGFDTVELHGNATGTQLLGLKNIEALDLSAEGANEITSLSWSDVLNMTGSSNTLAILGTSEDSVQLDGALGTHWTHSSSGGYNVYTAVADTSVVLRIEDDIHVSYI